MLTPLSVLDLVPVGTGTSAADALRRTTELAVLAERLGYRRYWFAEHHGMPGIASSAPELLIEHVAAATTKLRVGSGGIMLPNHVPLRIAEIFHTLEALHPGRIDLGIGRAPGTDPLTSSMLNRFDAEEFPERLTELLSLSRGAYPATHPFASIRVVPSGVTLPPIWMLGSSGASAQFAGSLGIGYSFARHFSPAPPQPAIREYRASFVPSVQFPVSHVILGVSVICAETDEEADYLARSADLLWVRLRRGEFAAVPSPEEATSYAYSPAERAIVESGRSRHFVGSPSAVVAQLRDAASTSGADELIITSMIHDHAARLRSYELVADEWGLAAGRS